MGIDPELADVANMSPFYFSQIFKSLNGFSAWDHIISCRVSMAKQLLLDTALTVLDIAAKCSFNNSADLNRQFKKITSLSPTEYRHRYEVSQNLKIPGWLGCHPGILFNTQLFS